MLYTTVSKTLKKVIGVNPYTTLKILCHISFLATSYYFTFKGERKLYLRNIYIMISYMIYLMISVYNDVIESWNVNSEWQSITNFTIITFLVANHPVSSNTADNNEYLALDATGMIQRVGRVEVVKLPVQARIVKVDLLHRLQIIKVICLQMASPLEPYKCIYSKNWIQEVRNLWKIFFDWTCSAIEIPFFQMCLVSCI